MKITKKKFGVLSSGEEVDLFVIKAGELSLTLTNFGGTLISLYVPSRSGSRDDVLLGFSTLDPYMQNKPYFGVTVGRFANRIAEGRFQLGGHTYALYRNDGKNTLHGGRRGFDKRVWSAEAYEEKGNVYVRLELESPDGEEGYPGNLKAAVTYGLTGDNELTCEFKAKVDAPCPVNFTNHGYYNLAGEGNGTILNHEVKLFSSSYLVSDSNLIPTGELRPVKGTPFDFTTRKAIGKDIGATGGGYDHCFTVDGEIGKLRPCAEVFEPLSRRTLRLSTTQPGLQFYSGNFLDGVAGKAGSVYGRNGGFCLETQHYPDSPNRNEFPSAIFGPDRKYKETAVYAFDW